MSDTPTEENSTAERRGFRRPLAFLILFVLVFIILDRLAGWGLDLVAESSQHRFSRIYRGEPLPSIVVLGHSRGVQLLSPEAVAGTTGLPVLNLSANGMSTEIGEALFLDLLDRGGKPKGLVVEITSVCSNNGLVRDLKMFANRSHRIAGILRRDEPTLATACSLFHVFRYNSDLMSRMLYHLRLDDQGMTNFFVAKPDFLAATPLDAADWQVQEGNPQALARLVGRARQEGIPVKLVVGPFWPAAEKGADVSERVIISLGSVTDEKVWDLSESITESRFFADHVHLNADGTMALHRILEGSDFFADWQKENPTPEKQ